MSENDPVHAQGTLSPGQRVGAGRYTLTRFLGKGGMGVVWLARDERLEEDLALKFLAGEISHDAESLADMRRETLKSRKLSHPNIIRIHDLFKAEGEAPFISMEFIDGKTLSALKVDQPQRLFSWEYLMPLVRQLCAALEYAHSQKVIHRDLKPGNMMVDANGVLKLADFGLAATAAESLSRLSKDLGISGTPAYMSPQQMRGQPPTTADDVYSLGATLYELLASKPPFYSGDIPHQVREEPPMPLDERLAHLELENRIPEDVAALIMACLSKEPEQRPPSAAAVAEWIGLEIQSTGSAYVSSNPVNGYVAGEEVAAEEAVTVVEYSPEQFEAAPEALMDDPAPMRRSGAALKWAAFVAVLALVALAAAMFFPKETREMAPVTSDSANSDAPHGVINLMPRVDVAKDAIKGGWELRNSRLISRPFKSVNLELPYRPPEEYDFHVTFKRLSGEKSVEVILCKNGRSFVWSMGGFDNTRRGFYFVSPIGAPDHSASLSRGIEFGRRYDVVVQVRNNVVRSYVDGTLAVEWPTEYEEFRLSNNWKLRNEALIGVGNDDGLVEFERIEVREITGKGTFTRTPTSSVGAKESPRLPLQTFDLVALTDPVKDRIPGVGNYAGGSNLWVKADGALSFRADGKPGKIAAPVAMTARGYEIEVSFARASGDDRFHIDLPVRSDFIVPLALGSWNDRSKIVMEGVTIGDYPPIATKLHGRVVARVEPAGGPNSKVSVVIDGDVAGSWLGDLAAIGKTVNEPHPQFPGVAFTSLWCPRGSIEFTGWTLRVHDGQAKALR